MAYVVVTWADAHAGPDEWCDPAEMDDTGEYLVVSLGHLLPSGEGGKDGHVTVAQSLTPDGHVDHILHIPTGMVRSLKVVNCA